jgi:hypothetical protein
MAKDFKPKSVKLLDIRKVKTKNGEKDVVQFAKGVKILFEGNEVDLGQYGTLFVKRKPELEADLDYKVEQGWITEEQKEQNLEYMTEKKVVASVQAPLK